MLTTVDQLGRTVFLPHPPQRIVSLVPSQTELLFYLGLGPEVVGITSFCLHPAEECRLRTRVGGTKTPNFASIAALKPDLIIGNKEENERESIEALARQYTLWMSDIHSMHEALHMIRGVGELVDREPAAEALATELEAQFAELRTQYLGRGRRVLYLIWRKPYMAAGDQTFIHDMLRHCGLYNCLHDCRYPELSSEEIVKLDPDLILLSSEPYPFRGKHIDELAQLCPNADIRLADGEFFSWYGSRLLLAPSYFRELLVWA